MEVCTFGSMSLISGTGGYDNGAIEHETTFGVTNPIEIFPAVPEIDPLLSTAVASTFLVPVSFASLLSWSCKYSIMAKAFLGEKLFEIGSVTCFKRSYLGNDWEYEITGKSGNVEITIKEQKSIRPSVKDRVLVYDSDGQLCAIIVGRFPHQIQTSAGQPLMKINESISARFGTRVFRVFWNMEGNRGLLAQITRKCWRVGRGVRVSTCLQFARHAELDWHYRMIVLALTITIEHTIQRNISLSAKISK